MAVLFALLSSITFGAADFSGGMAARSVPSLRVAFLSQVLGLPALAVGLALIDADPMAGDLWWGALGGAVGGLGLIVFYGAVARGPISVVTPVTALMTGVVPLITGLVMGERPSALAWMGVVLGLGAIVLISREGRDAEVASADRARVRAAVVSGLVAGATFGAAFVAFDQGAGSGPWQLVGARAASMVVLLALVMITRTGFALAGPARGYTAAAGLLDMTANMLVIEAFSRGLLSLVSVITALYPATTIVLARFVLHERVRPDQRLGLAAAVAAILLISLA